MSYLRIDKRNEPGGLALDPSDGGRVVVDSVATFPPPLEYMPQRVILGALSFQPGAGSAAHIDALAYRKRESNALTGVLATLPQSSVALLPALALFGEDAAVDRRARETEQDTVLTRREVILGALAAVGAAQYATGSALADGDTVTVAEFDVTQNPRGLAVGLADEVADVLPADREYTVLVDATPIGTVTPRAPRLTLAPGLTGAVTVKTTADVGLIEEIQGLLSSPPPAEFTATLPKPASELEIGEEVTVFADVTLVEPVRQAGGDATVVTLGGASVAHADESGDDAGTWVVRDGAFYFTPGDDPPNARELTVVAGVGTLAELKDDVARKSGGILG